MLHICFLQICLALFSTLVSCCCVILLFLLLDEEPLIYNFSDSTADHDIQPDIVTPALTAEDTPLCTSQVPCNSSSVACQSQLRPQSCLPLTLSDVSEAAQCHRHSSPTTSQSDVDFSSPDTADYAKAAENVSDMSDSYRHSGSHVQPFTDVFDTQPADLVHSSEDSEPCSNDCMVTGLRDSGKSVRNGKNADEAVSGGLVSVENKHDACGLHNSLSVRSLDMPSSYATSAIVAVPSDRADKDDAADLHNYSSQLQTIDSTGAKSVTGPSPDFCRHEPLSSDDSLALDSSSLDPGYQRASVTAPGFSAETHGPAASLSQV